MRKLRGLILDTQTTIFRRSEQPHPRRLALLVVHANRRTRLRFRTLCISDRLWSPIKGGGTESTPASSPFYFCVRDICGVCVLYGVSCGKSIEPQTSRSSTHCLKHGMRFNTQTRHRARSSDQLGYRVSDAVQILRTRKVAFSNMIRFESSLARLRRVNFLGGRS